MPFGRQKAVGSSLRNLSGDWPHQGRLSPSLVRRKFFLIKPGDDRRVGVVRADSMAEARPCPDSCKVRFAIGSTRYFLARNHTAIRPKRLDVLVSRNPGGSLLRGSRTPR